MNIEQLERLSPGDWFHDVRDQLKWHVYRRSEERFAAGDAARAALSTATEIRERQKAIRERFVQGIGGLPASAAPPAARITGTLAGSGYRVEKLIYESRPRVYVTASLYVPDGPEGPRPAVLFLCGHAAPGKAYPEYQRVCQLLVQAGFVVLAQDPIGQGERLSYWEAALGAPTVGVCTLEHDHAGAQCAPLGWALARFFLHDAMRSLDYLCSRPDVDETRIGLTGNSGGGTQSCLLMMADSRIAAAAPGTFIMNRQTYMYSGGAQDAEQIWPGFTEAGFDHADVLISMAPKPVCVLAVTDDFFPIEGTRATVAACRHVWQTLGVADMPALVEDQAGHAYTERLACASVRFFGRALRETDIEPDYSRTAARSERDLNCTVSGQVRTDFPDARFVFEECATRLEDLKSRRETTPEPDRQAALRRWVRERVYRHRTPCDLNLRTYFSDRLAEMAVDARVWWSQPGLMGHALTFRDAKRDLRGLPATVAVWDGGTDSLQPHLGWIRGACAAGRAVHVLDASGVGALKPHSLLSGCSPLEFYGVIHKLADDLTWLDDSLAALRVYDVLRAIDAVLAYDCPSEIGLFADASSGRECIYAILAAASDDRVSALDISGGIPRFADWVGRRHYDSRNVKAVILPGILEIGDLDDLA